jgi:hypothetical protein
MKSTSPNVHMMQRALEPTNAFYDSSFSLFLFFSELIRQHLLFMHEYPWQSIKNSSSSSSSNNNNNNNTNGDLARSQITLILNSHTHKH